MDFWNTVLGTRLAETLCKTLPKIAEKGKQEVIRVNEITAEGIKNGVNEGRFRFVGSFTDEKDTYVIIEK